MGEELEIHVWYHQVGQPRPYADSVYEATVKAVIHRGELEVEVSQKLIFEIVALLVHEYEDPPSHALAPRLEILEKESWGTWHVRIVEPFTD